MHFPKILSVPVSYIRRLVIIAMFWTFLFFLCLYIIQIQNAPFYQSFEGQIPEAQEQYFHHYANDSKALDMIVNIDQNPSLNEIQLLKILSRSSNLPLAYWAETKQKRNYKKPCLKLPNLYDLDFNNIYWQKMKAFNATFYLYGAYYDNRERVGEFPLVRIVAMVNKIKPPSIFCQFWYNSSDYKLTENLSFSKASFTYMWYKKWGNYKDGILQPFVISCPVPQRANISYVPTSVSLAGKTCEKLTNNIKIFYKRPKKKSDFAVCVKGLDFLYEDKSVRLVEWIELLKILGAKKIFFYELEVHENMRKVLSYYVKKDFVELTPLTLPGNQPNLPGFRHLYLKSNVVTKRQNELIPYNDCFYKNIHSYEYIALLDTDEVIMPLIEDNWKDLMDGVLRLSLKEKNYTRASYNFRNVYFLDDLQPGTEMSHVAHEKGIPNYLHMLQHVYRTENYTKSGSYVKCFHNTERVVSLHNHFPMNCFGQCTTYEVNTTVAHLQHYRKDCVENLKKTCGFFKNHTIRDTSVWRFKNELIRRTTETLHSLGFFKGDKTSREVN